MTISSWAATWLLLGLLLRCENAAGTDSSSKDWWTRNHGHGYCALFDICGRTESGGALSCPSNIPSRALSSAGKQKLEAVCPQLASSVGEEKRVCCTEKQLEQIESQMQAASIFLIGCPACLHNFKHLICLMTCSPNQAMFTNVTSIQSAADTGSRAVKSIDVFVDSDFGDDLFDSCANVVYPALNQRAMKFVGGGATNFKEWMDFVGTPRPGGSPFEMNFILTNSSHPAPQNLRAINDSIPSCGDAPFTCSCGDCPSAPGCSVPPPPPPEISSMGCPALHIGGPLSCLDISMLVVYLLILALIPKLVKWIADRMEKEENAMLLFGEGNEMASPLLETFGQDIAGPSSAADNAGLDNSTTAIDASVVRLPVSERLERKCLRWLGYKCASFPLVTLTICVLAVLIATLGILKIEVVTKPEKLWVGPESEASRDKADFEASFGPYYRVAQMILKTSSANDSIVKDEYIRTLFSIQDAVDNIKAIDDRSSNITLSDVCFRPTGSACATQSVLEYWQGSLEKYEFPGHLSPDYCIQHWSIACLARTGAPINPRIVLGGFPRNITEADTQLARSATAFVITYPLVSSTEKLEEVKAWEAAFVDVAENKLTEMSNESGLLLSFSTERSVQDELQRESGADVKTVTISYLIMLLYISVALGSYPKNIGWKKALVRSRFLLAFSAVMVVCAAVASSLGTCGWMNIKATLIIMEVIPFLVLAVGIDNAFLLIQRADGLEHIASIPRRVSTSLASVGPSMLFAAATESLSFAIATLTSMPALENFAACAALAIAFCFFLQITALPAILALDLQRQRGQRFDIFPFLKASDNELEMEPRGLLGDQGLLDTAFPKKAMYQKQDEAFEGSPQRVIMDRDAFEDEFKFRASIGNKHANEGHSGTMLGVGPSLQWYMKKVHIPLLQIPYVKGIVLALFVGLCLCGAAMMPRLQIGLDQSVVLPRDSFLQRYFADVVDVLRTGPPVTFVVQDLNVSEHSLDVSHICSTAGCSQTSLLNQINAASRNPWESYVATPAASWIDDFRSWVSPEATQCCRIFQNGSACPPPDQPPCWDAERESSTGLCDDCTPCLKPGELKPGEQASKEVYIQRLPQFLSSVPSPSCAKGGVGAYSNAFKRDSSDPTGIAGLSDGIIQASSFTAYYAPLSSQHDFISALISARRISDRVSRSQNLDIFPYAVFHIFFEQYLTIDGEAAAILGSAAVTIFMFTLIATGSLWASTIILITIGAICLNLVTVMVFTGIQVNAVSLVNLAAAVGIGVEFCIHVLHSFMEEQGTRDQRASAAMKHVGTTVLSGIGATKFFGVLVLAFARTEIFRIYYFKFYMALVVLGAVHGLVFLPCILSVFGPDAFEGWIEHQRDFLPEGEKRTGHVTFEVVNTS